jgi:hypothetical protein
VLHVDDHGGGRVPFPRSGRHTRRRVQRRCEQRQGRGGR